MDRPLFSWFDLVLVLILGCGFWRGRKNGMTGECLPVLQWLVIVIAAGLGCKPLGDQLIKSGVVRTIFGSQVEPKTAAYISSYLIIALVVWVIFTLIKRRLKARLEGSNFFGSGEYYLGMISGVVRYACMTLFGLALLGAPYYSPAAIAAHDAYVHRWYGGGMKGFSGNYIPSLSDVQFGVFNESRSGPCIKSWFAAVLINTAPDVKTPFMSYH